MIQNPAKMADADRLTRQARKAEKFDILMAELRSKVECPVCLAVPTKGPMASCVKGHLVCLPCHQRMLTSGLADCPTCREPMARTMGDTIMSLLAKTVIENIEHECTNQGCDKRLPYQEVTRHKKDLCKFRMVLCPGQNSVCKTTLPFSSFNDHAKICKGLSLMNVGEKTVMDIRFKKNFLDRSSNYITWKANLFQIDNEEFVLRKKMANGKFTFTMLMVADRDKCNRFMVTLAINVNKTQTVFLAQFNPTPLSMENSEEASLVIEKKRFAEMISEDGDSFKFDFEINVSEKRALS